MFSKNLHLFRVYGKGPKSQKGVLVLVFYKGFLNDVARVLIPIKFTKDDKTDRSHIRFYKEGVKILVRQTGSSEGLKAKTNANSLGKTLADAGERATILSLFTKIDTPEDTKEAVFINNPSIFENWKATFKFTKGAIEKAINRKINSSLKVIHDASHNSEIANLFQKIAKRNGWGSKDSWCPADIYLIDKNYEDKLITELKSVAESKNDDSAYICKKANAIVENYAVKKKVFSQSH